VEAGTVRLLTPGGQAVWHWDGHSIAGDDDWMDDGKEHSDQQEPRRSTESGSSGDDDGAEDSSESQSDRRGAGEETREGEATTGPGLAGGGPGLALRAAAPATTLPPATTVPPATPTPAGLGPLQRVPIRVGGTVVGIALVQLPQPTALPAAVAFPLR
jgi:hypothetical protein